MAGKPRQGIGYAGWSVDIFDNDTKIDGLLDAHGWVGFSIYFYLCMRAFGSDGYFYRWGFDLCASTSRKMGGGVGSGTVRETVGYCLQIGLFDKRLFEEWGVLTSKGIQRSYWAVLKTRRVKAVYQEFWLLEKTECEGVIFVPFKSDMSTTNDHLQATNADLQATNDLVVKKSKVKSINTMCKADASALFECLWELYPSKKGKGQVSDAAKMRLLKIGQAEMERAIERYKAELKKDEDWRKPQNGSTFFNSGYVDYLDANFEPSRRQQGRSRQGSNNQFNQFQRQQYDFDELENELLGG